MSQLIVLPPHCHNPLRSQPDAGPHLNLLPAFLPAAEVCPFSNENLPDMIFCPGLAVNSSSCSLSQPAGQSCGPYGRELQADLSDCMFARVYPKSFFSWSPGGGAVTTCGECGGALAVTERHIPTFSNACCHMRWCMLARDSTLQGRPATHS